MWQLITSVLTTDYSNCSTMVTTTKSLPANQPTTMRLGKIVTKAVTLCHCQPTPQMRPYQIDFYSPQVTKPTQDFYQKWINSSRQGEFFDDGIYLIIAFDFEPNWKVSSNTPNGGKMLRWFCAFQLFKKLFWCIHKNCGILVCLVGTPHHLV